MSPAARIVLVGVLFATGGALIKVCEVPALQRAAMRALIAAITIFALVPATRRRPDRHVLKLIPAYFGTTCAFVVANSLTTAASTIFLSATAPLWVLLLSPFMLGERAKTKDLVVLTGIGIGMGLCFLAPNQVFATAPNPALGNLLALVSGVAFALLLIGMRRLANDGRDASAAVAAWGSLATCPMALALMPVVGQTLEVGTTADWLASTFLGVFQVGLAYVLLASAVPHVPAVRVSLLLMIEPALNPLIAFAMHSEVPHAYTIIGGAFIIGSVATGSLIQRS